MLPTPASHAHNALFRIGAVSKTTGIPVSTLRIWENRYGAFNPIKSSGNQRLYDENDVSKAILLKQLLGHGHSIGAIARLDPVQLRHIAQWSPAAGSTLSPARGPAVLTIVGTSLANRVESGSGATGLLKDSMRVAQVYADVSALKHAVQPEPSDILLVKTTSMQHSTLHDIQAFVDRHAFAQALVLYNFAPEAVVKAMKFSGFQVRREPISDLELGEWLHSVVFVDPARAQEFGAPGPVFSRRKYSDATLARVAGISTDVLCECPRHVAELIAQLASFEEYSQECLNHNTEDAHLHAFLRSVSGSARSLFENAREKIALHEGIDLSERNP